MTFYEMKHGMSCGSSYDYLGHCSESDAEYVDIAAFNELKKMLPRWIPVSEGLPDQYESVLVYDDEYVLLGYHDSYRWFIGDDNITNGITHWITHWMKLPKGPVG